MSDNGEREKVWFDSGGTRCAAWHYPGRNGACVIMAGGFAVTKEPGTDLFAKRFHDPGGRYPDWQQAVAARSALRLAFGRPGRAASRVRCPLLVLVCDQDRSALAGPAIRAARRAPGAELVRLPGGHYAPFLTRHEEAVAAELAFLRRHLPERSPVDSAGVSGP
jgi:pimeloyl-ACP methyl ester carboxylesterase